LVKLLNPRVNVGDQGTDKIDVGLWADSVSDPKKIMTPLSLGDSKASREHAVKARSHFFGSRTPDS
jgi:hypothetical protein